MEEQGSYGDSTKEDGECIFYRNKIDQSAESFRSFTLGAFKLFIVCATILYIQFDFTPSTVLPLDSLVKALKLQEQKVKALVDSLNILEIVQFHKFPITFMLYMKKFLSFSIKAQVYANATYVRNSASNSLPVCHRVLKECYTCLSMGFQ